MSSPSTLPDPALPAPPLSDDDVGFTADQLIARQRDLEEAAREAVPFSFLKGGCTYEKGYIRQPVFACKTCGGGGVCAGCSVGCHADHDLVELFAKRSFRCDCGSLSLCRGDEAKESELKPCSLRSKDLTFAPQNDDNKYGKNFKGQFCRCERGKTYNAETEEETMFQCLVCEDWLHESCTSLRPSKQGDDINNADRQLADGPLVDHESFDLFICSECSRKPGNEVLQQYLGRKGWIVCLREGEEDVKNIRSINVEAVGTDWTEKWKVYGLIGEEGSGNVSIADTSTSIKRKADDEASQEDVVKKVKVQDGESEGEAAKEEQESFVSIARSEYLEACTKPEPALSTGSLSSSARFDVFLAENFREQVCRCKGCITEMSAFPYIAEPEETYSPPQSVQDNDDANSEGGASQTSSSYDLGLAALQRLPRAQMMESLDQYNKMRDALFNHLRPFAESGRVVDGESLREFFRKQREDHH